MNPIKELLQHQPLIFDGAMGTYWNQLHREVSDRCELANLHAPEDVLSIHRAYLDAGCHAIKTNTFAANPTTLGEHWQSVIQTGWALAQQSIANRGAFVFADIGPIPQQGEQGLWQQYQQVIDCFLSLGAEQFLFETNSSAACLIQAAEYIHAQCPNAFVLVSFAVQPDGYTREGNSAQALLSAVSACPAVDAAGFNCVSGAYHMRQLIQSVHGSTVPLSAMPNAGYPVVVDDRTHFEGDSDYYALQMAELAGLGVRIFGGCCGTTPEHIRKMVHLFSQHKHTPVKRISPLKPQKQVTDPHRNNLWDKVQSGKKIVAVELDPPRTADLGQFMSGAWTLKAAGVDAITLADCPIGRARMDASLLACKLRRELGIDPIPHMTCRDRNLNATKALLLGLSVEGVDNVLVVTGDPIPTAERDEVKSVFHFNSRKLGQFICTLNEHELESPFRVYGALNINARNFHIELKRAMQKEAAGISGFLTQPVLSAEAVEHLKEARAALNGVILGGMMPVVSYRNACFMDSEISGIHVCSEIKELYRDKDRTQAEALAIQVTAAIAERIAPLVDGYYMITPFNRTALITAILEELRHRELL